MYALHTTEAFVVNRYLEGESNYVYKLFTKDHGMLYAHGRGVRDLKSKNRYALRTHKQAEITIVRGKGMWRITGAHACTDEPHVASRRALALVSTFLPVEDPVPRIFSLLCELSVACKRSGAAEYVETLEAVYVLRLLHELGYVARPRSSLADEVLSAEVVSNNVAPFVLRHSKVVALVNTILGELSVR